MTQIFYTLEEVMPSQNSASWVYNKNMPTIYRIFIGLIIAACSVTFISLLANAGIYLLTCAPKAMDFMAFFTSAQLLMHAPNNLYNLHSQQLMQQSIAPITKQLSLFIAYVNPPFVALLFVPLLKLELLNAYLVWLIINALFLVIICFIGYRQLNYSKLYVKILAIIGIITFIPILTSLLIGQLSILLSLILLLTWIFLKKGWNFRSGLMLSLLLIKPQFLLLPFLAVLIQRRSKLTYGLIIGIIVLILISYLLVGANGITNYLYALNSASHGDTRYDVDLMAQHSIQTLLLIVFHTRSIATIQFPWLLIIFGIALPTLFVWTKKFPTTSPQFSFQWILLIFATLLTSPHTHFHDLSFLIVAAIMILSVIPKSKSKHQAKLIILLILGYLIALIGYLFDVQTHSQTQSIWIVINVTYMFIFWLILLKNVKVKR
jgi:hypothetical protein